MKKLGLRLDMTLSNATGTMSIVRNGEFGIQEQIRIIVAKSQLFHQFFSVEFLIIKSTKTSEFG